MKLPGDVCMYLEFSATEKFLDGELQEQEVVRVQLFEYCDK